MTSDTLDPLDALRDAHGAFSMLAIDQRASLRSMLAQAAGLDTVDDDAVIAFKNAAARWLSPKASAMLVDRDYGTEAAAIAACPIILATGILSSSVPDGPVDRAELDGNLTPDVIAEFGAAALKILVPWTPNTREAAVDLSAQFMDLCRRAGLPGIVEGVVRPADITSWPDQDRDAALVTAAQDLAATHPDLYKAEVPSYGAGSRKSMVDTARRITESLECPWVVLSSGVTAERFPAAVSACRAGGASGFLAGRAIWADAITSDNTVDFLRTTSVARLEQLTEGC